MAGGKFGHAKDSFEPLIVASYKPGQTFKTQVVLTAHHDGFFEWRLCDPKDGSGVGPEPYQATQACFDKHVLQLADPTQGMRKQDWNYNGRADRAHLWDEPLRTQSMSKWKVPPANPWTINRYTIELRMPDVACERCVIQWYYQTGNSQGAYPEEFWNCADVEVLASPKLNIDPPIIETQQSDNEVKALGKCGLSGEPNGKKCFSKDVRVTDGWCDKIKCDPAFGSMCAFTDVDAECAALVPLVRAGQLPNTPKPTVWTAPDNFNTNRPANTNTNNNNNNNNNNNAVAPTPTFNYNFWQNNWNYNTQAAPSAGGAGGSGSKTVTTTTSTTTSTYH
jgi:hypothetical protein